jgi:16S rRNA (cytosine1402-N4)-methyltransferase
MEFKHQSVLLNEVIENLNIKESGTYVDGTLGGGAILLKFAKTGRGRKTDWYRPG